MKGIDVSVHNGAINWPQVKADGVEFAIIRAGYGNSTSQKDQYFDQNMQGALAAGIPVGCYWFSYAVSPSDAQQEAEAFLQVLTPYQGRITYPLFWDYEYDSIRYSREQGVEPTKSLVTDMANAFLGKIRDAGYTAGNYTNLDFYNNWFEISRISGPLWYAQYEVSTPSVQGDIWQYTSDGSVSGISGRCDMNVGYTDYSGGNSGGGDNGNGGGNEGGNEGGDGDVTVTGDGVRIRADAQTAAEVLGYAYSGDQATVLADDGWGWSKVVCRGITGWMSNEYLSGAHSGYKTGVNNGSGVRFRTGPSTSDSIIRELGPGTSFTIIAILPNQWLNVRIDGTEGYLYNDPSYISLP